MHDEITNSEVEGFKTSILGSSRPEVFLRKSVLKICRKFTGDYLCRSVISIQLLYNFIENESIIIHQRLTPSSKEELWN